MSNLPSLVYMLFIIVKSLVKYLTQHKKYPTNVLKTYLEHRDVLRTFHVHFMLCETIVLFFKYTSIYVFISNSVRKFLSQVAIRIDVCSRMTF